MGEFGIDISVKLGSKEADAPAPVAGSGLTEQWSDTFARADSNALGGDWIEMESGVGWTISGNTMTRGGNFTGAAASAAGDAIGSGVDEYKTDWTATLNSWSAAGFAMGHLDDAVDSSGGFDMQTADGYYMEPTGASSFQLMRRSGGTSTQVGVWATGALTGSHKYTLHHAFNGSECTVVVYIDDAEVGSYTDATPPTGLQTSARPACHSSAFASTTVTLVKVYY